MKIDEKDIKNLFMNMVLKFLFYFLKHQFDDVQLMTYGT
jgi:hypothetical protein